MGVLSHRGTSFPDGPRREDSLSSHGPADWGRDSGSRFEDLQRHARASRRLTAVPANQHPGLMTSPRPPSPTCCSRAALPEMLSWICCPVPAARSRPFPPRPFPHDPTSTTHRPPLLPGAKPLPAVRSETFIQVSSHRRAAPAPLVLPRSPSLRRAFGSGLLQPMIEIAVFVLSALPFVLGLYALRMLEEGRDDDPDDPPPPDVEPPPVSPSPHTPHRRIPDDDRSPTADRPPRPSSQPAPQRVRRPSPSSRTRSTEVSTRSG